MNELDPKHLVDRANRYDQSGDWPSEDLGRSGNARCVVMGNPDRIQRRRFISDRSASALRNHRGRITYNCTDSHATRFGGRVDRGIGESVASPVKLLLPKLPQNNATIGIAQLTTSRQGGAPVLQAQRDGDAWIINGLIPWSTGPDQAQFIVAGAAVSDDSSQQDAKPSADLPGRRSSR